MRKFLLALLLAAPLGAATLDGSLFLSGDFMTRVPGATVGWGGELHIVPDSPAEPPVWIMLNSVSYLSAAPAGTFDPILTGPFRPLVILDSISLPLLLEPLGTSPLGPTGIGTFAIDPLTPPGTLASGSIEILYSVFSYDPFLDPPPGATDPTSGLLSLDASFTVYGATLPTSVPEPASLALAASALLALTLWKRIRR